MKLTIVEKNLLSWTAMHIDFMCKNERGTLWTKFALVLGGFRIVSKKWTDQCEDSSLKKKKVTAIVGHFSLKGKRAD